MRLTLLVVLAFLLAGNNLTAATPAGTLVAAAGSPFAAGTNPGAIVVGDFNGDGKTDIAVANRIASNGGVNILLGDGNGGFRPAPAIIVGGAPWALAAGDFNGDKNLDLAVANYNSNSVTILFGDGSGGFTQAGPPIATGGSQPSAVVTADFNKDGNLDLAVANLSGGITVLLGNGKGIFTRAIGSPFQAGDGPIALAVGDFDADGAPDIVVANSYQAVDNGNGSIDYFAGTTVTVLKGTGFGSFIRPLVSSIRTGGQTPDSVAIGDFDGDGRPDVAVAHLDTNAVTVLKGNGFGSFSPFVGIPIPTGLKPSFVTTADFDGDGLLDLAVTNQSSNTVAIVLGRAGGFAPPAIVFSTNAAPLAVVAADFNGDGRADLATANGTGSVTVLLGAPASTTVTLSAAAAGAVRAQVATVGNAFSAPGGTVTLTDGTRVLSTVTPVNGVASFDVSSIGAGVHALTATYNGDVRTAMSISNTLTITVEGPVITISGVANGASFAAGVAAPNTILSLFGTNLGCTPRPEVRINGVAVEVLAASDRQINMVVSQQPGSLLEVVCGNNRSAQLTLPSATAAPAIFTAAASGTGQGSILNRDGSVNSVASAAARGDYISVYGTGFGELAAPDANGLRVVTRTVTAFIGEVQADVQFAGAAPGYTTGLQQINVRIPPDAPTGSAVPVRLVVDGASTQSGVTAAVR